MDDIAPGLPYEMVCERPEEGAVCLLFHRGALWALVATERPMDVDRLPTLQVDERAPRQHPAYLRAEWMPEDSAPFASLWRVQTILPEWYGDQVSGSDWSNPNGFLREIVEGESLHVTIHLDHDQALDITLALDGLCSRLRMIAPPETAEGFEGC